MASTIDTYHTKTTHVGMGQIGVGGSDVVLTAVLGSCLGLALHDEKTECGALAHIVLPKSNGLASVPGKFADTAVSHMVEMLKQRGARPDGLVAKITGGACMFGDQGLIQIGKNNVEATTHVLREMSIPIVGTDVGGTCGRRVSFDCPTGLITIERVGQTEHTL